MPGNTSTVYNISFEYYRKLIAVNKKIINGEAKFYTKLMFRRGLFLTNDNLANKSSKPSYVQKIFINISNP